MGTKRYKPTSPGRRGMTGPTFEEVTKKAPEKALTEALRGGGGRNNNGHVTLRFRGGGHKRRYRIVDFKRDKRGVPAKVAAIEYDPNRTARIALLHYADGEKRYILAPVNLKIGQAVVAGPGADIIPGNALPLSEIPEGTEIHNVEIHLGKGGQICRSAGNAAQLMAKEGKYALVKLPSGEMRRVLAACYATVGRVGNVEHEGIHLGKAGRTRWMGRRPHVRGVAMNPVDHPMGGGEGKTSGGRHPCSPWGWKTKGAKTRRNRSTDKYIVKRRK